MRGRHYTLTLEAWTEWPPCIIALTQKVSEISEFKTLAIFCAGLHKLTRVYTQRQGLKGNLKEEALTNILGGLSSIETVPVRGQYYLVMIPDSDLNVNIAVLCNNVSRKHTNCSYSRVTTFSHLRIHKLGRKFFVK